MTAIKITLDSKELGGDMAESPEELAKFLSGAAAKTRHWLTGKWLDELVAEISAQGHPCAVHAFLKSIVHALEEEDQDYEVPS